MTTYLQAHLLTIYPVSVPNRDDDNRPKTLVLGGTERQRISSQALKRAIRQSETFQSELDGAVGVRTKYLVDSIQHRLEPRFGEKASEVADKIGKVFGQARTKMGKKAEQGEVSGGVLLFLSHTESRRLQSLVERSLTSGEPPSEEEIQALPSISKKDAPTNVGADVGLMGRMAADTPALNVDAALAMSHAYTVHKASIRPDYWTGMGDPDPFFQNIKQLNERGSQQGADMIGIQEHGSGIYYTYFNINMDLLARNMGDDPDAARRAAQAFLKAAATTAPSGKKSQYGQTARASYILVEKGSEAPRALHEAFIKPVEPQLDAAIEALRRTKGQLDRAYGSSWVEGEMCVPEHKGSLSDLIQLV